MRRLREGFFVRAMNRWRSTFLYAFSAALLLVVCALPGGARLDPSDDPARRGAQATMRQIFQTLTTAFTLSLNGQQFEDPANHPQILDALRALSQNATNLETHGQELNPSFGFLRRSLARDAREALKHYEEGDYKGSRFVLHQLTENCFACHSRLPSPRRFDLGKHFIEGIKIERLPLKDRVRLQVATRQFDAALEMYEAIFRSPSMAPAQMSLTGAFGDYLKLSLRVRNDFARAIATLEGFRQRPDMPRYLTDYIVSWVEALKELQHRKVRGDPLTRARTLIREGQSRNRFPADRQGLLHFVVASSVLHRYLDSGPTNKGQLSEAYYLLGVTESYISRSFWISETEFFLESAIRLDPKSPLAEKAYVFLEEYTIAGYTGSLGLDLPPDVRAHLEELRRLIDGS